MDQSREKRTELNLKRPVFFKDVTIKLIHSDFNDYIKSIDFKGKHFIYASNICNFNLNSKLTEIIKDFVYSLIYSKFPNKLVNFVKISVINKISLPILENKNILEGSILFAVGPASAVIEPYPPIILLFIKQKNKLNLIKTISI